MVHDNRMELCGIPEVSLVQADGDPQTTDIHTLIYTHITYIVGLSWQATADYRAAGSFLASSPVPLFWRAGRRGETKNRAWYRLFAHALENIMNLIIKSSRDATDIIINIFYKQ